MTIYPDLADALAIHGRLIELFGGSMGIRDLGALESALARPQTGYDADLLEEAAALWESLSQNHPFVDGNKRVSIAVTAAFLSVNGFRLSFSDMDAYDFIIGLYESGQFRWRELDGWIRNHVEPIRHC